MAQRSLAQIVASALIYSATAGFRHDSIPTAIEALKTQGSTHNIHFDDTEDASFFTEDNLAQYDVLVFLMNTGEGAICQNCQGCILTLVGSPRRQRSSSIPEIS
jgi:hypothetical protein